MINGIRQQAIVGKGGRVEILSPELPVGTKVEIIVLIEEFPPKTTHKLDDIITSSKKPSWDDFFNQTTVFGDDFLANRDNQPPQDRDFFQQHSITVTGKLFISYLIV